MHTARSAQLQANATASIAKIVCAVAAVFAFAQPTLAGSSVSVPRGFQLMCTDHPSECRGGGASEVAYSKALMAKLDRVNREVNRRIIPVKNEVIDVWSVNAKRGDCEDYVLAKRKALIAQGIPASAMSIVYALRNGGGHAILAVHTSGGSYVLDNMTGQIKSLRNTGYKLVSMSGPNPRVWQRLTPTLLAKK